MYEDNEKLIKEYQEGNKALFNDLVEGNLGLVHLALKSFKWAYNNHPKYDEIMSYDDFFQEGVLGLCGCLETYDPELGVFSSYALQHIKQAIYRFYYDKGRVIRVPYEPRKAYKQLRQAELDYINEYGYEPSTKELSEFSGIPFDSILDLRRTFADTISLDIPLSSEDESLSLSDVIEDKTDYLYDVEREMTIKALRHDLERMAQDVIKDAEDIRVLFYYFDNIDKKLAKEIIAECSMTKSKFYRVIDDSIRKISRKYLDELIEGYSDLFSSGIRRVREHELYVRSIKESISLVASKLIKPGDNITILAGKPSESLKNSLQATVRIVDADYITISYVGFDVIEREYLEKRKRIGFNTILDFRTENKKIVEIYCREAF